MYPNDVETSKRINSIHPGRAGIPPRTFSSSSGEAISFNSVSGFDGIPSGVQDGRVFLTPQRNPRKERWRDVMKRWKFSVAWVTVLLTIGAAIQGWH